MTKYHLKRKVAPKTWPVVRKETKFIMRPRPSGHTMELTLPITVVLREILGVARDVRQVRAILREQEVTVNGSRIHQADSAVAFMDVLSIGKESFRIIIDETGQLAAIPVKKGEEVTLQQVSGKTALKGGMIQINLLGGMNVLLKKDKYKVGDTVAFDMARKPKDHFERKEGATVLVTGGSHIGKVGTIKEFDDTTNSVVVTIGKEIFRTSKQYAFVIGKDKPAITLN